MNLHYCRFVNTCSDFEDCIDGLDEFEDLSEDEQKYAERLYKKALRYIEKYEYIKN